MPSTPFYGAVVHNGAIDNPDRFPFNSFHREAYEVLRVIEGIPLFFMEHLNRLERTLRLISADIHPLAPELYIEAMHRLLRANAGIKNANVRMSLFVDEAGHVNDWWIGFTPHKYPSEKEFQEGVAVMSINAQRRDPNAKLMQYDLRSLSESIQAKENVYETILLEPDGEITEGSRSNIFFIKDGRILTAPDHKILEGVTRAIVIDDIHKLQFPFAFQGIDIDEISSCQAAFLTGTSRDVLPIKQFDRIHLNPTHPLIKGLQQAYSESVNAYLVRVRSQWQ